MRKKNQRMKKVRIENTNRMNKKKFHCFFPVQAIRNSQFAKQQKWERINKYWQNKYDCSVLTPNVNGMIQSRADKMYVKNKFACIVLRKHRRSLVKGKYLQEKTREKKKNETKWIFQFKTQTSIWLTWNVWIQLNLNLMQLNLLYNRHYKYL